MERPTSSPVPSTELTPKPASTLSKSRYKSPLSSLRNNYKPPVNSPAFKPKIFSSPVSAAANNPLDDVSQTAPRTPVPANMSAVGLSGGVPNTGTNESNPSLEGRGGEWRGPSQSDMLPENRNLSRFRQGNFPRSPHSPQSARDDSRSPYQINSSTPNRNNSFNRNNQFDNSNIGSNSYGNSFDNNSFGSNSSGNSFGNNSRSSQRGKFNSYNSPAGSQSFAGGNRKDYNGGQRKFGGKEDMSLYYHKSMTEDPWAQLVQLKARGS